MSSKTCRCGQEKPEVAKWCYQCKRRISGIADMSRLLVLSRIREAELQLALYKAALEVGNEKNIS